MGYPCHQPRYAANWNIPEYERISNLLGYPFILKKFYNVLGNPSMLGDIFVCKKGKQSYSRLILG